MLSLSLSLGDLLLEEETFTFIFDKHLGTAALKRYNTNSNNDVYKEFKLITKLRRVNSNNNTNSNNSNNNSSNNIILSNENITINNNDNNNNDDDDDINEYLNSINNSGSKRLPLTDEEISRINNDIDINNFNLQDYIQKELVL